MNSRLKIGMCVAAAMLGLWGAYAGTLALRTLPRYQVDTGRIQLELEHSWVDDRFAESMQAGLGEGEQRQIFDPTLLGDMASALAANPWVREVRRIERVYPSHLSVSVELRSPEALIVHSGKCYLVDRDGVRLPGEWDSAPELDNKLPVLEGLGSVEPPIAGQPWPTEGIDVGFSVAELLQRGGFYERVPIHAIDVSYDEACRDRVVTVIAGAQRTRVKWGKSPLNPDPADAPLDRKLANLETILARYPGLIGLASASVAGEVPSVAETPDRGQPEISRR